MALRSALGDVSKAMGQDADEDKVSKVSVDYRPAQRCGTCSMYESGSCTLVSGKIDPMDVCDKWEAKGGAEKSAETPMLASTHNPLGPGGLWQTPSRRIPQKESLPSYVENIAHALERAGHSESESIAMAIAAIKRWSKGYGAFGSKGRVTPVVQQAAADALAEWERLKEEHAH